MDNSEKCLAAVLLGRMGKGIHKKITEDDRERRRKQMEPINARRRSAITQREKEKAEQIETFIGQHVYRESRFDDKPEQK